MTQKKLTGRGGPDRGQGRKPISVLGPYRQYPLKLPPEIIEWLEENRTSDAIESANGFIVAAIWKEILHRQRRS